LKSGSINLLEHSGPVQARNGIALTFTQSDLRKIKRKKKGKEKAESMATV
jgi:hypothetical protein